MRLLLTGQPMYSHLVPALLPLAVAAGAAGHQVALATAASMSPLLVEHGITPLPLPHVVSQEVLRGDPALARRFDLPDRLFTPGRFTVEPAVARRIAAAYAGPIARLYAEDLLVLARDWRPEVVVGEPATLGGYLAAEVLGRPHAIVDISPFAEPGLAEVHDVVNRERVALGLPVVADPTHPYRYLRAGLMPADWYPPRLRVPTGRHYRVDAPIHEAPADPELAAFTARGPYVLVALGSLLMSLDGGPDVLPMLVGALAELGRPAVLALGGAEPPGLRATLPDFVHLAGFAPQRALLAGCELFVTHAGFNSVREAAAAGVPVVALPFVSDQPGTADRVAEVGHGLALAPDGLTAADLARACRRVLTEPRFRARARRLRAEVADCPGLSRLVADLAALAGGG
jgi:UDP:flavonoid glycosyltransferase YjiC (YdhE family)